MNTYDRLLRVMNTVADLGAAGAILGWDQETYMPDGSVSGRANQLSTISSLIHHHVTCDETKALVGEIRHEMDSLTEQQRRIVKTFIRDHEMATKLPVELVEEMSHTAAMAQDAWKRARASSDFSIFKPLLEKTVELKRKEASLLGAAAHPYDNLLDQYEPGLTVAAITPVFERLRQGTVDLLSKIGSAQDSVSDAVLYKNYGTDAQLELAQEIISKLGFSFSTGRVDLSAHPFCTNFGKHDVRLTTRIREHDLRSCLFGLIHEAGHGMYEQGIGEIFERTPAGQGASMGIHESQSLFWENVIARSEEFWHWAFPALQSRFPDQVAGLTPRDFFRAINKMQPSLNRVESDELTYNLHIILRFEIERDLIGGVIEVSDVPTVWNDKMKASLGVVPPNDAEGCLQDVHWSFGGIGYFPSYTLGKLYAAMEWNAMQEQMPDVKQQIRRGEFGNILAWLRSNIHAAGRSETPAEIVQRVCGRALTEQDFLAYVSAKAHDVYELA